MADRYPMTPRGLRKLREELKRFQSVERPANVLAIEEAREHGDLSENADYDAAKDRQAFIDAKIRELEAKTSLAEVIDPATLSGDRVVFGATITMTDTESGEEKTYAIVGEDEADINAGRIAVTAPIIRGLIGREVGDVVKVRTPKGPREFEIIAVKFLPAED
ncbi:MAG: transcription elongation factor GreA [Myxococcales bacterium]|nr:transcription elongation factor GreA [Myxococcales bacterium]